MSKHGRYKKRRRETLNAFNDPQSMNRKGKDRHQAPPSGLVTGVSTGSGIHPVGNTITASYFGGSASRQPEAELPHRRTSEPVVGWRAWRLREDENGEPVLVSAVVDTQWTGPVFRADQKPGLGDNFGVHALRLVRLNREYQNAVVEGEVLLFGKVIVFQHGIRAEAAMIRRLVVYPGGWANASEGWYSSDGTSWSTGYREYQRNRQGSVAENRALVEKLARRYDCDVSFMPNLQLDERTLTLAPEPSLILCPHCERTMDHCGCGGRPVHLQMNHSTVNGCTINVAATAPVYLGSYNTLTNNYLNIRD